MKSFLYALVLAIALTFSGTFALAETQTGANNTPTNTQTGANNTAPQRDPGGGIKLLNPLGGDGGSTSLMQFIQRLLQFIIRIGTIVVIVMLVYTGFLFVKARGKPGEITEAKNALLWTLIGGLILLGSQAIAKAIEATVQALSI